MWGKNANLAFYAMAVLGCILITEGFHLHGMGEMVLQCQCVAVTSIPIHPRRIQQIQVNQKTPFCNKVEVIATLRRNQQQVCLDPEAKWVNHIFSTIQRNLRH
ncbi:interleukin-8 [Latimeria chalumnae]|uniref:interleukin-8 n=1 Tax=Latimeria chalumnae TaxID=7897 RepID=UPI00313C57D7